MNVRLQSSLLAAGSLLALAGCGKEKPVEQIPPLVQTAAVEQYAGEAASARYSASVTPYAEVPLSFKVEGIVTSIKQVRGSDGRMRNIQGGDAVRAGEVLAKVRQDDYTNPVDQARAQVDQSRAQTEQTKAGVGQGQAEVRRTEADRRAAESARSEALASLQLSQSKLLAAQAQEREAESGLNQAQAGREQAAAELQAAEVSRRQAETVLDQSQESLRQAKAMVTARQAAAHETKLTFERQTNLFRISSTTKAALDQATASHDVAQANVEQAKAQVSELEAKVRQAREEIAAAAAQISAARARIKGSDAKIEQAQAQRQSAAASVRGAQADVEGSQAKIAGAKERVAAAEAGVSIATSKLAGARAEVRGATAQVRGAQAGLQIKRVPLSDTLLRAPMNGVLLKRNIEVGALVQPATFVALSAAFTMADTERVKVVFGIPDSALPEVRLGATYTVSSEALRGQQFRGTVTGITPAADPKSRVFQVEVTIPNPQGRLKSGMIVTLEVGGRPPSQPVAVVPLPAIVRAPGTPSASAVFVAEQQGDKTVARVRQLSLGQAFGNNRIQVLGGLNPGDRIIVSGAAMLQDGQTIRVAP